MGQSELPQTQGFRSDQSNGSTWWTWSVPSIYKESYIMIILTYLRHPNKLNGIEHLSDCNVSSRSDALWLALTHYDALWRALTRSDASDDDLDGKHVVQRVVATRPAWSKRLEVYVSFSPFLNFRGKQYSRKKSQHGAIFLLFRSILTRVFL